MRRWNLSLSRLFDSSFLWSLPYLSDGTIKSFYNRKAIPSPDEVFSVSRRKGSASALHPSVHAFPPSLRCSKAAYTSTALLNTRATQEQRGGSPKNNFVAGEGAERGMWERPSYRVPPAAISRVLCDEASQPSTWSISQIGPAKYIACLAHNDCDIILYRKR
jgi:hypothetical protein